MAIANFDKDVFIRNAKSIFEFHEQDDAGYVYYRLDRKKGIRLREAQLQRLLNGERIGMDFGTSGRGTFYADFSKVEARKREAERRARQEADAAANREREEIICALIPDDDPQLVEYVAELKANYAPMTLRPWHKAFIYGIRTRHLPTLIEVLAHGRGWNDTSKAYFRRATGEPLPMTKRDIQTFLETWCNVAEGATAQ